MIKIKNMIFAFAVFFFAFFTVSCNGSRSNKATPVYQGMEISSGIQQNTSASLLPLSRSIDINQEDPFLIDDEGTIDDLIEEALIGTIESDVVEYYATMNQEFYITVKLENPDDFIILSFTLNGVFYQSYQFQEGSDSENLILKVNSGSMAGIKEYTIDAIKYIDGEKIKDVIFEGDRTARVGIMYDNEPTAAVSNFIVGSTSMSFDTIIVDSDEILADEAPIMAYLYNGNGLFFDQVLQLGNNSVAYDRLIPNTLYQYAVATIYDNLDGLGKRVVILEKEAKRYATFLALCNFYRLKSLI